MTPYEESLYGGYSYNNWAKMSAGGALGGNAFPWGLKTPLNSLTTQGLGFANPNPMTNSMAANTVMPNMNMGSGLSGLGAAAAASNTNGAAQACHYNPTASPYMSRNTSDPYGTSINALRIKAKQHASPYTSPYASSFSACQYAP